jgi:hypothetical protein
MLSEIAYNNCKYSLTAPRLVIINNVNNSESYCNI